MSLTITITDAGRQALVNAQSSGTAPVTITEIALGSGQYAPSASQGALASEFKRVDTISGEVVSGDTINVVLKDESSDDYQVGEFGLYTNTGLLFAVFSQAYGAGWVAEKFAGSSFLLAVDVVLETLDATSLTFGDLTFTNPPASETVKGVVELADSTESVDRGNHERASTPKAVHQAMAVFGLGIDEIPSVSDFNGISAGGLYFGAAAQNSPGTNCFVVHSQTRRSGLTYASQIAVRASSVNDPSHFYFRIRNAFNWSGWQKVWSEASFDPDMKANASALPLKLDVSEFEQAMTLKANASALPLKLDVSEFNQRLSGSIASSGYQRLPSGLIVQWGRIYTATDGAATVVLPISFPVEMFQAQATLTRNSPSNLGVSTYSYGVSSFAVRNSDAAQDVVWVAIGR